VADRRQEPSANRPENDTLPPPSTRGGPESNTIFPARTLNNHGGVNGDSQTAVPEPNCFLDCYFSHAALRRPNDRIIELPFPAGIEPVSLVMPGSDMHIEFATGINDKGEIAANAIFQQVRSTSSCSCP
jgi:hypothetical protein